MRKRKIKHTSEMFLSVREERHIVGYRGSLKDQCHRLEVPLGELAVIPGEGMSGDKSRKRQGAEELHDYT